MACKLICLQAAMGLIYMFILYLYILTSHCYLSEIHCTVNYGLW